MIYEPEIKLIFLKIINHRKDIKFLFNINIRNDQVD